MSIIAKCDSCGEETNAHWDYDLILVFAPLHQSNPPVKKEPLIQVKINLCTACDKALKKVREGLEHKLLVDIGMTLSAMKRNDGDDLSSSETNQKKEVQKPESENIQEHTD